MTTAWRWMVEAARLGSPVRFVRKDFWRGVLRRRRMKRGAAGRGLRRGQMLEAKEVGRLYWVRIMM